jgi:hypothetical protein
MCLSVELYHLASISVTPPHPNPVCRVLGGCRGALEPHPARSGRPERTGEERQPRGLAALGVLDLVQELSTTIFLFRSPVDPM